MLYVDEERKWEEVGGGIICMRWALASDCLSGDGRGDLGRNKFRNKLRVARCEINELIGQSEACSCVFKCLATSRSDRVGTKARVSALVALLPGCHLWLGNTTYSTYLASPYFVSW